VGTDKVKKIIRRLVGELADFKAANTHNIAVARKTEADASEALRLTKQVGKCVPTAPWTAMKIWLSRLQAAEQCISQYNSRIVLLEEQLTEWRNAYGRLQAEYEKALDGLGAWEQRYNQAQQTVSQVAALPTEITAMKREAEASITKHATPG